MQRRMLSLPIAIAVGLAVFPSGFLLHGCVSEPSTPGFDAGPRPDTGPVDTDAGDPCHNGVLDRGESSIDCGGGCEPCPDGAGCARDEDCRSLSCERGFCLMASCTDGVRNGSEFGVDCGIDCGPCGAGEPCDNSEDCLSGICRFHVCAEASCTDRIFNGDESDTDCGGSSCRGCLGGSFCNVDADCASLICVADVCTTPSCTDHVQNQDESAADCGGVLCPGCRNGFSCRSNTDCMSGVCYGGFCIACSDRIQNGDESDVDCGGPSCRGCADGLVCRTGADCASGICLEGLCISCADGVRNAGESDVDCGGPDCGGCADGLLCVGDSDCFYETCVDGVCISCWDGVLNQDEIDVDCGGSVCDRCAPGRRCVADIDCASLICDMARGRCNAPGCGDGVLNGEESDLDCGGSACLGCMTGQSCFSGRDCDSGVCAGGTCQEPTCTDRVANGGETDADCGGPTACPRCPDYDACDDPSDCITGMCTRGRCGDTGCIPFPRTSTDGFGYFGCTVPFADPADLNAICPDISATGTFLPLSDDDALLIPVGFPFDFYGSLYSDIYVNSNGGIGFDGFWNAIGPGFCGAVPDPSFGAEDYLAIFWDDLYPPGGAGVWYELRGVAPNRELIIRYDISGFFSTSSTGVFSAVLREGSNNIDVCYHDTDFLDFAYDGGIGARAGIHHNRFDAIGPTGLDYSCERPELVDGLLIQYIHP